MKPRSGFEPGLNRSAGDRVTAPPPWQSVEPNTAYQIYKYIGRQVLSRML